MPKINIDYSKTLIYKIVCNDTNCKEIYVGSTTDFTRRKNEHKQCCNNNFHRCYNLKIYKIIRDNGGWINWSMIEIEKYPCHDGNESRARERYYFEILNASLNTVVPNRTLHEYYENNKIKISENKKEYYIKNKEKIKEYKKEYENLNKEKIQEYQKEYSKEYRQENNNKIKELQKQYYKKNRDKILNKTLTNYECICGSICRSVNKAKHEKTKKHQNIINQVI
jgi:hypothetical protein